VTRATIHESIDVLSFMSSNRILGVRGNNDQKVIEWRAWMNWILSSPGGQEWLSVMDRRWPKLDGDKRLQRAELENWIETSKYASWKKMVPAGWYPLGKHYRVARAMSPGLFEYLTSLPLVLHSQTGHMVFVHAGLLSSHPKLQASDPRQPLSHWPTMDDQHDIAKLRNKQELAVLTEIPENKDPWTVTNIKSVTNEGIVSTSPREGTPWSQLWNDTMSKCSGKSGEAYHPASLPCYPFTVVYGHVAGRGLDIKRWSIGLDTGCVSETKSCTRGLTDIMCSRTAVDCQLLSSIEAPSLLLHTNIETTYMHEPSNHKRSISEIMDKHVSLVYHVHNYPTNSSYSVLPQRR